MHKSSLLQYGDWAELSYPKDRQKVILLQPGKRLDSAYGFLNCDDLVGRPEGSVVSTSEGTAVLVMRATLGDYTVGMPRGAAIIFPRDCALILGNADIYPGLTVVEAGVGSGSLSLWLLRALAGQGRLYSFEVREEFAQIARRNAERFYGQMPENWTLIDGELSEMLFEHLTSGSVDRVVLDMLKPWLCLEAVTVALKPGGIFVCYAATLTQVSRLVETLRNTKIYTEPQVQENIQRSWHVDGLAIRPSHGAGRHTGFIVSARRLFEPDSLPAKRKRASKNNFEEGDEPAWLLGQISPS